MKQFTCATADFHETWNVESAKVQKLANKATMVPLTLAQVVVDFSCVPCKPNSTLYLNANPTSNVSSIQKIDEVAKSVGLTSVYKQA